MERVDGVNLCEYWGQTAARAPRDTWTCVCGGGFSRRVCVHRARGDRCVQKKRVGGVAPVLARPEKKNNETPPRLSFPATRPPALPLITEPLVSPGHCPSNRHRPGPRHRPSPQFGRLDCRACRACGRPRGRTGAAGEREPKRTRLAAGDMPIWILTQPARGGRRNREAGAGSGRACPAGLVRARAAALISPASTSIFFFSQFFSLFP